MSKDIARSQDLEDQRDGENLYPYQRQFITRGQRCSPRKDASSLRVQQPHDGGTHARRATGRTRSKRHTRQFALAANESRQSIDNASRRTDIAQTPVYTSAPNITRYPNARARTRDIRPDQLIIRIRVRTHCTPCRSLCIGTIDGPTPVDVDRTREETGERWWGCDVEEGGEEDVAVWEGGGCIDAGWGRGAKG